VFAGGSNATFYDDGGLSVFTTYQYRLTVYNDFYFAVSPASSPAVTFGGVPTRSANVTAHAVNHTSIDVHWTLPCKSSNKIK